MVLCSSFFLSDYQFSLSNKLYLLTYWEVGCTSLIEPSFCLLSLVLVFLLSSECARSSTLVILFYPGLNPFSCQKVFPFFRNHSVSTSQTLMCTWLTGILLKCTFSFGLAWGLQFCILWSCLVMMPTPASLGIALWILRILRDTKKFQSTQLLLPKNGFKNFTLFRKTHILNKPSITHL